MAIRIMEWAGHKLPFLKHKDSEMNKAGFRNDKTTFHDRLYNWALVSEPGFLDFQIVRFSILEFLFLQNMSRKYVGEISRNE